MHVYSSNIFQRIHIAFSNPSVAAAFSMCSHLQMYCHTMHYPIGDDIIQMTYGFSPAMQTPIYAPHIYYLR
jgi:hypothetical protein